jgi:hypothetical protein
VDLAHYQGNVQKSATASTNDPQQQQITLTLKGLVKPYIQIKPSNTVQFRGVAEQLLPVTIDLITAAEPFQIKKVESNLDSQVKYEIETLEPGKHYRLQITNQTAQGRYSGFIRCFTDHPQRPELTLNVTGFLETEITVSPLALLLGRPNADQPPRTGDVNVINNRNKAFQITKLSYDDQVLQISQEPLSNRQGYVLKVAPRLENIPPGEHRNTVLTIETDSSGGTKDQVRINVVNR